jgi:hypothetical protein
LILFSQISGSFKTLQKIIVLTPGLSFLSVIIRAFPHDIYRPSGLFEVLTMQISSSQAHT